jgi:hypothetical protein
MQAYELAILCSVWTVVLFGALWTLWISIKNSVPTKPTFWLLLVSYALSCVPIVIALAVQNQASLQRLIGPLVQCGSLILVATEVSLIPILDMKVY